MRTVINFGQECLEVEVPEGQFIGIQRRPIAPPLPDPAAAVRAALESPLGFPALRQALTPDDHVAVVVDEKLPHLSALLSPVLEHICQAGVAPEAVTLLCPASASRQEWINDLPDAYEEVRLEVHDPTDRKKLSYLATTRRGHRLYLNRTAVDADQLVVLARRGYDPLLGYSGAAGAIYPALSDEQIREEANARLSLAVPGDEPWPLRQEAIEAAWLLGAPFLIQVVPGSGDDIAHIVAGLVDTRDESQRLLDARWRVTVERSADTVLASLSGDPSRFDFAELAQALANAARVVRPRGRIILLSPASPHGDAGMDLLRQAEDPDAALSLLREHKLADPAAAFQWASAAQQATIYLLIGLPAESAEELFAIPLDNVGQVQRLLNGGGTCLLLPDADKSLAITR